MKVICFGNRDCENYVHEKEFDVDEEDFDNACCPECGGKIAPAWTKDYRLPGEDKLRTELKELYDKKSRLDKELMDKK